MATIGVIELALDGHARPANRLAAVLARRGHRVLVWADERYREEVGAAGAEMRSFGHEKLAEPLDDHFEIAVELAAIAVEITGDLVEQLLAEDVDLVVHDSMAAWGRVAANWLGLPHVSSNPLYPVDAKGLSPRPAPLRLPEDIVASLSASRLAVARRWGIELGSPLQILANPGDLTFRYTTPEIVGLAADTEESWRFVGPMIETPEDDEVTADPTDGRPLVYMALGTLFNTRRDLFRAVLDGLADEPVRLIVSTGRRHSAQDLAPVPPNAVISEYVSSPAVLRQADLHITHGGGGSVHESLWAGVPMLCLPQGADQIFWTQRVRALGAGEWLTAETPERIREAVRRLLDDPAIRATTRVAGERLRAYDGPGIAVRSVEELLA